LKMTTFEIPDEVVLEPHEYDLPQHAKGWAKAHLEKMKQPVKVTRRQMVFFGERGVPWPDIEKFYNVDRITLMRYYKTDYEKGVANTNIALRNRMVDLALNADAKVATTMLIWLGKNRLQMSDNGATHDAETGEDLTKRSTEELMEAAQTLLNSMGAKK